MLWNTNAKRVQPSRHALTYTGALDRNAFEAKCRETSYWYHSLYFDNGFYHPGDYDIGLDISDYGLPTSMEGMSVLDVGTGSGWFAAYFEQLGARVTTLDVRGHCDHDVFGRPGYPDISTEKGVPDRILSDGRPIYDSYASRGFWILKEILGLKAEFVNARVYDICPELFNGRMFDLVFIGSLLMHLRDPIGALMAVRSVCREKVVATSWLMPENGSGAPVMQLMTEAAPVYWWQPNRTCLTDWFRGSGFPNIDVSRTVRLTADNNGRTDALKAKGHAQTLIHASV